MHGSYEKRLVAAREEAARLRESLRVVDEQVVYLQEVADEAQTRALVAGTPLADRQSREAAEDLRRVRRQRDEIAERISDLADEQDRLLERLLAQSGGR